MARVEHADSTDWTVSMTLVPDGPYSHSLFRRLLAARMSGGVVVIAGVACVVTGSRRTVEGTEGFEFDLTPRYISSDVRDTVRDVLWYEPATDPRFSTTRQSYLDLVYTQPDRSDLTEFVDVPQALYSSAGAPISRKLQRAARRLSRLSYLHEPSAEVEDRRRAPYHLGIEWADFHQFVVALTELDDLDRRLLDLLVYGSTAQDIALFSDIGVRQVRGAARRVLKKLGLSRVVQAAFLVGLAAPRPP